MFPLERKILEDLGLQGVSTSNVFTCYTVWPAQPTSPDGFFTWCSLFLLPSTASNSNRSTPACSPVLRKRSRSPTPQDPQGDTMVEKGSDHSSDKSPSTPEQGVQRSCSSQSGRGGTKNSKVSWLVQGWVLFYLLVHLSQQAFLVLSLPPFHWLTLSWFWGLLIRSWMTTCFPRFSLPMVVPSAEHLPSTPMLGNDIWMEIRQLSSSKMNLDGGWDFEFFPPSSFFFFFLQAMLEKVPTSSYTRVSYPT